MATTNRTQIQLYFSGMTLIFLAILFSYFLLFLVWEVDNYFINYHNIYLILNFIFIIIYVIFMIHGRHSFFSYIWFRNLTLIPVFINLLMGCGGMWFYFYSRYISLLISIIIPFCVLIIAIFKIKKIHTNNLIKYIKKINIIDLNKNIYSYRNSQPRFNEIINEVSETIKNKKIDRILNILSSVGSPLPFLVMGVSMSLDRLGMKMIGLVSLNALLYFLFILLAVSNFTISYHSLNIAFLRLLTKEKKSIRIV